MMKCTRFICFHSLPIWNNHWIHSIALRVSFQRLSQDSLVLLQTQGEHYDRRERSYNTHVVDDKTQRHTVIVNCRVYNSKLSYTIVNLIEPYLQCTISPADSGSFIIVWITFSNFTIILLCMLTFFSFVSTLINLYKKILFKFRKL